MRKSRIKSESSGRYLLAEIPEQKYEFEEQMILSMAAGNLLKPGITYDEGIRCFSFNVTDCRTLEEYLGQKSLTEQEICSLMIQLNQATETLSGYLLKEGNLLLGEEQVFVDKNDDRLLFCAVPGEDAGFSEELHAFLERLIMSVDLQDSAAVTLCVRMFRESAQKECRLYDLMNEIIQNRRHRESQQEPEKTDYQHPDYTRAEETRRPKTGRSYPPENLSMTTADYGYPAESPFADTPVKHKNKKESKREKKKPEPMTIPAYDAFPPVQPVEQTSYLSQSRETGGSGYKSPLTLEDLGRAEPLSFDEEASFHEDSYTPATQKLQHQQKKGLPDAALIMIKILVAEVLLGAAIAVVYFLKGKELMLRLLPIYGILAIAVILYFIAAFFMEKKSKEFQPEVIRELEGFEGYDSY